MFALNGDAAAAAAGSNYREKWISALVIQQSCCETEIGTTNQLQWGQEATYGEEGGQVEAEKDIGVVEEVADAHGGWWTRKVDILSYLVALYKRRQGPDK